MSAKADYELAQAPAGTVTTIPPGDMPRLVPTMTATEITCSVRRVMQPKPYESWECSMAVTVKPDPALTTGQNLERVHALLAAKIDWACATWSERHNG